MSPDIQKEHALETYKSLINISVVGLKLLALLNGGAAVALLAFIGNISDKGLLIPDMRVPMGFFLGGLSFVGIAFFLSYRTQYILYQEEMQGLQKQERRRHVFWLIFASISAMLSLLFFIIGSILAVWGFQSPCSYNTHKVVSAITIKSWPLKAES